MTINDGHSFPPPPPPPPLPPGLVVGQTVSGYSALLDTPAYRPCQLSPVSVMTDIPIRPCPALVCFLGPGVAPLTSQQHASVSQGRICSDNFSCCRTEIEVSDPTFYLTQSQYTDTGPASPCTDPITPGAWQGSHWSANFEVTGMTRPRKNPGASGIRTRDLPLSRRTP